MLAKGTKSRWKIHVAKIRRGSSTSNQHLDNKVKILNNFNIVDNDILYFQQGFMDKVLTENFFKKTYSKNFEKL